MLGEKEIDEERKSDKRDANCDAGTRSRLD
jgi:hypothetical protein